LRRILKHLLFTCLLIFFLALGSLPLTEVTYAIPKPSVTQGTEITVDTVWSIDYRVVGTVTVRSNATLTIMPDVLVAFDNNATLVFEGSLIAVGNSTARIVFTSTASGPKLTKGLWDGLVFVGGNTTQFILKYVDVEYAKKGVTIAGTGKVEIQNAVIIGNSLSGIDVNGQVNVVVRDTGFQDNKNSISSSGNFTSGLEITNNLFFDNENGVYLEAFGGGNSCGIFNVRIIGNNFTKPGTVFPKDGTSIGIVSDSGAAGKAAVIRNVTISHNNVFRSAIGVRLLTSGAGAISNSTISSNVITFNEIGIQIYGGSSPGSAVSDVLVSDNEVFQNYRGISLFDLADSVGFDAKVFANFISACNMTGLEILGSLKANLTMNWFSYSSYGVVVGSGDNLARRNDVYRNSLFGMYVNGTGTIDATDNYWGNTTGPYHESLNVLGKGDRVNGNGVNLRFDPFSSNPVSGFGINQRPVPKLKVSEDRIVNASISFDASASSDDFGIMYYRFDFDDGNVTWTYPGVASHVYSAPGLYNVSVLAMDVFGVLSASPASEVLNVTYPFFTVYVVCKPASLFAPGSVSVAVHVTNGSQGIDGVAVELFSDGGGSFDVSSGFTDGNGDFNATYSSPKVTSDTTVTITVRAFKSGFSNASKTTLLPVLTPKVDSIDSPLLVVLVFGVAAVIVVAFLVYRRQRQHRLPRKPR
jgi:hypothetical protein